MLLAAPNPFALSTLNGTNGFVLTGIDAEDRSGRAVSSAGDVNGDGFDDVIVGAYNADSGRGESYVVFGKADGFSSSVALASLDGTNGFVLKGLDSEDVLGRSVSDAGDINGDGFDDVLLAAPYADQSEGDSQEGESYVIFGKSIGFSSSFALSGLDGSNGFLLTGIDPDDEVPTSISSAGDVNGDGLDDLLIGVVNAGGAGRSGESYVVFGKSSGFASSIGLSSLNGTNGFILAGSNGEHSGVSVSGLGDVNGDGIDDLIIGAVSADQPDGARISGNLQRTG